MKRIRRVKTLAIAAFAALALAWVDSSAQAQGVAPSGSRVTVSAPANGAWSGYATNRANSWYAYTSQPSAWSSYVYRGTASSGVSSTGTPDMAPRHVAYGYRFNPGTSHWEHGGYGGKIPNYGHAGRYTEMPRPWVWWGSTN